MPSQFMPLARHQDLIVQSMDDEIVLYDTLSHQAHVLNRSAALVWKFSDGKHTIPQLAQLLASESNAAPSSDLVRLALKQLSHARLLEQSPASVPPVLQFTRREFLQKAALAAMVVPMVKTISAPTVQNSISQDCFVADTPVLYHDGTRRSIESVTPGDLVLARDERSGVIAPQPVEKLYVHPNRQPFTLDFGSGELDTTAVHPFYTDSGWLPASALHTGMDCYLSDGSRVTLVGTNPSARPLQTVYNLEVANFHTFFVGTQSVWVHNKT